MASEVLEIESIIVDEIVIDSFRIDIIEVYSRITSESNISSPINQMVMVESSIILEEI